MNHLKLIHLICKEHIQDGQTLIDATTGNGHDTLFLANLIKSHVKSKLFGYDIQKKAILETKRRLGPELLKKTTLKCISHENIHDDFIPNSVDLILFNLGYLPGHDKSITTTQETTIQSCQLSLNKLTVNGLILIAVYPGHPQGKLESLALLKWIKSLPQRQYKVHKFCSIHNAQAPFALTIQKH